MAIKIINNYFKFCLIIIIYFCFLQTRPSIATVRGPVIKVLIAKDKKIRIRSDRSIPLTITGQRFEHKKIKGLTLKQENNRPTLFFDKNKQKIYEIRNNETFEVKSTDRRGIWVGKKRFSGKLKIFINDNEILVVNIIGIENYLSSVVGSEMPAKWPMEALKAQAIASRTYALKQKGNLQYDIDSTNKNQVYSGLESITYKTSRAVTSTRSLVLTYKNKLINSLFHSSSAGMTENSQDVWKNEYPYLSSVKDFDKNNPKLKWEKRFSYDQLLKLFPRIGGIKQIKILEITKTGRVKKVLIVGKFASDEILGVDLRKRMKLDSTLVRFKLVKEKEPEFDNKNLKISTPEDKSLNHIVIEGDNLTDIASRYNVTVYDLVALNDIKDPSLIKISQKLLIPKNSVNVIPQIKKTLVISGYGSGHGVGMSQWGAKYMATNGEKAEQILKHFYSGVKIKPFKKYFL